MKQWDVFISHASEDKEQVALPLTLALRERGVRVWLDKFELRIGDSLRVKIDEGLSNSRCGIVILSQTFFEKFWTGREVDAIFSKAESTDGLILPIWHHVDKKLVAKYSPMLSGILAGNTSGSMDQLAQQIADRVFGIESPVTPVDDLRTFAKLLGAGNTLELRSFLHEKSYIIGRAFGRDHQTVLISNVTMFTSKIDFCSGVFQPSTGQNGDWKLVSLVEVENPLSLDAEHPSPSIKNAVSRFIDLQRWVAKNIQEARRIVPGIKADFAGVVVGGRRPQPASLISAWLQDYNDGLLSVRVRSYDWIFDALLNS